MTRQMQPLFYDSDFDSAGFSAPLLDQSGVPEQQLNISALDGLESYLQEHLLLERKRSFIKRFLVQSIVGCP